MLDILYYPVSSIGPTTGPEKFSKWNSSDDWNTLFLIWFLQIQYFIGEEFYAEFTESMPDILLYPESGMGLKKYFQNQGSQKAGKCYFLIGFCKYSKCFLQLYALQLMYKH